MWTEFTWLVQGQLTDSCEHGNEFLRIIKLGIS